jgi:hypothetical protein
MGHRGKMLQSINVVWKHLKLIQLTDLVLFDGVTLCQETLEASEQGDSNMEFPREKPTKVDRTIWKYFISSPTVDYKTLQQPFGE